MQLHTSMYIVAVTTHVCCLYRSLHVIGHSSLPVIVLSFLKLSTTPTIIPAMPPQSNSCLHVGVKCLLPRVEALGLCARMLPRCPGHLAQAAQQAACLAYLYTYVIYLYI